MDNLMTMFYTEVDVVIHFTQDQYWEILYKNHCIIRNKEVHHVNNFPYVSSLSFHSYPTLILLVIHSLRRSKAIKKKKREPKYEQESVSLEDEDYDVSSIPSSSKEIPDDNEK